MNKVNLSIYPRARKSNNPDKKKHLCLAKTKTKAKDRDKRMLMNLNFRTYFETKETQHVTKK